MLLKFLVLVSVKMIKLLRFKLEGVFDGFIIVLIFLEFSRNFKLGNRCEDIMFGF